LSLETDISLHIGSLGELEGGLFIEVFERRNKEGSGRGASLHRSDLRGTRREGSSNQDPERRDMEVSGKGGFFFVGLYKGNLRHLVQGVVGLGQYIYWTGTCT
jgi:hypothetical protein